MKQFIKKAICFAAIQAVIAVMIIWLHPVDDNAYLRQIRDKHKLINHAPSPRMILVGGSSMTFGLDCQRIKKQTAYNPVNMALHASFGMGFMLNEVSEHIRPGDIVILSFEYQHFQNTTTNWQLLTLIIEHWPRAILYLGLADLKVCMDKTLTYINKATKTFVFHYFFGQSRKAKPPYVRSGFNEFGDMVIHRTMPSQDVSAMSPAIRYNPRHLDSVVDRLNVFHRQLSGRKASVYLLYPAIPQTLFQRRKHNIHKIDRHLRTKLTMPILNKLSETVYPPDMFFDTVYHLNHEGAIKNTEQLLRKLTN